MHLSSSISLAVPSSRPCLRLPLLFVPVATLLLLLSAPNSSQAGSATWLANPATEDWNTATNWTTGGPPNGPSDTAFFATSNTTGVSISAETEVDGIVFNAGASAFTITVSPSSTANTTLTISGVGISNNSGIAQNFVTAVNGIGNFGTIAFTNSATAGSGTVFTNNGSTGGRSGIIQFLNTSTAGNGTFTNNSGTVSGENGGGTQFFDISTAGNSTFTNNGDVSGAGPGFTQFFNNSTAGNGIFINNGGAVSGAEGGVTEFFDTSTAGNSTFIINGGAVSGAGGAQLVFEQSAGKPPPTAGNATLIANGGLGGGAGGLIEFTGRTLGDTARVEVFGDGTLDMSFRLRGATIGSIEGSGLVFLGAFKLSVGSNDASTTFAGLIQDGGGNGGTGGSLHKTGMGKLVLTNANTYTGGTTIKHGKLLINNTSGSGTGSGPVQVNGGRLGGKGTIAGAVTVGTGISSGAVLSPGYQHGANKLGALTIESPLTFNADATYEAELNSSSNTADEVIANGVTINSGAQFSFADLGSGTLTPGTVFTVINNTAATPIAGTFSNLPDGSIFTSNGNTYQVSYEGGDGNDLTLTVIP
jgi:fibronectin-binding autotransporter adhesin